MAQDLPTDGQMRKRLRDRTGDAHGRQRARQRRGRYGERYLEACKLRSSKRWQTVRRLVLEANPLCVMCWEDGTLKAATQVDHIQSVIERPDLAFDESNLQGLCDPCHYAKSAAEARARYRRKQRERSKR